MPVTLTPDYIKSILYGGASGERFTQNSPVLLDVWQHFCEEPSGTLDVLITPHKDVQAHHVADRLDLGVRISRDHYKNERRGEEADIADVPGVVVAKLYLDEIVNFILPNTRWWRSDGMEAAVHLYSQEELAKEVARKYKQLAGDMRKKDKDWSKTLASKIDLENCTAENRIIDKGRLLECDAKDGPKVQNSRKEAIPFQVQDGTWRLLIVMALLQAAIKTKKFKKIKDHDYAVANTGRLAEAVEEVLWYSLLRHNRTVDKLVHLVTRNRRVRSLVSSSVPTTKADAARKLFETDCSRLTWAIIDSGIDETHYAFRKPHLNAQLDEIDYFDEVTDRSDTRVERTFDFTRFRKLRSRDFMRRIRVEEGTGQDGAAFKAMSQGMLKTQDEASQAKMMAKMNRNLPRLAQDTKTKVEEASPQQAEAAGEVDWKSIEPDSSSRPLDWDLMEPLLEVEFGEETPESQHGTHVAGILGAGDLETADLQSGEAICCGMCPDIGLYDFRVLADTIEDTEFAIISALRFIRHLNERNDFIVVHGVNMSLSLDHDVDNFACGRTPVCVESERLVENGVVVVAAAGNRGYQKINTKDGSVPVFVSSTITDPGNAELIITVGSTHRLEPHNYGISYFSSRGPTGDGRLKPDLVAPGEKIKSAVPNLELETLGGTSMAAPHVSGAAAMLMARFEELIGNPRRVKQILCDSATDLGREPYFQGRGMLDVLRAMQSI